MKRAYSSVGSTASRHNPTASPALYSLFLIAGIILPVLILTGCGTAPESEGLRGGGALQERVSLREGEQQLSEGRYARLASEPFSGMQLFREDFSQRQRFGESYVFREAENEEENSFCRLSSPRGDEIFLADTDAPRHEGDVDERLRNFSLSMRLRFTLESYGELTIEGRRYEHDDFAVYAGLSSDGYSLSERTETSDRQFGAGWWEDTPKRRWIDVELLVIGERASLMADGRELITSDELRRSASGGVILSYQGELDIDDIELRSFDIPETNGAAEIPSGEALVIEELRDDFSGEVLSPWWHSIGRSEPSGNQNSELHIYGSEDMRTAAGIVSQAIFPRSGRVRAEFWTPHEDDGLIIGFGKPEPSHSVSLFIGREWIIANRWVGGRGKNLFYAPIPPGTWNRADEQELELTVQNAALHLKLNGTRVLRSETLEDGNDAIAGYLFLGYTGDLGPNEVRSVRQLGIDGKPAASFDPEAYPLVRNFPAEESGGSAVTGDGTSGDGAVGDGAGQRAPDYPAPGTALVENFETISVSEWYTGSNDASSARAEIIQEPDNAGGTNSHLALHFRMREGRGLHANVGTPLRANLSSSGGIAFRARGEGIKRAHISLGERSTDLSNDRNDAFFQVDEEWREYRLPFSEEYFTLFDIPLSVGSDGSFDYSRVEYLMFEVYGYEGQGSIHVDDIRLLPQDSNAQLNRRISIENFELNERRTMLLPHQELYVGDDSRGSAGKSTGDGALNSSTYMEIHAQKRDYVDFRMDGTLAAQNFAGFGFFIQGSGIDTYRVEMRELEPRSSFLGELEEQHIAHVPLNGEWVEWRFPFSSAAFQGNRYHPLSNGTPDGWVVTNFSFLYPYFIHDIAATVNIDELFLYEEEQGSRVSLGLFTPRAEGRSNTSIAGIIQSVLDLNLRRVANYQLTSGLVADDRDAAFDEAERKNLQFFLRPLYTLEDDALKLSLEVCDTTGRRVSSRIHIESPIDTDIFARLDELSIEVVNSIADTDLVFEERIETSLGGEAKVWRDALDRVETYWLRYDELQAAPFPDSGESGLTLSRDAPMQNAGYNEQGSVLRIPMMLTEPYFTGIEELRAEVRPEGGAALLLWNYRARDSYNFLRIKGSTVTAHLNGYERRFHLDDPVARNTQWRSLRCSRTGAQEYEIAVDGTVVGTVTGPDLAFGRLGLGIEGGPASFRNIAVEFSE